MKGLATMIVQVIMGLVLVMLAVLFYMIFVGNFFDIQIQVKSGEVERHAVQVANALMSSPSFVYVDEHQTHRGVFDREKLDKNFNEETIKSEISFPNSVMAVRIQNVEDTSYRKELLMFVDLNSLDVAQTVLNMGFEELSVFQNCLGEKVGRIFAEPTRAFNIFNLRDVDACYVTEGSKRGLSGGLDFPATIRYVGKNGEPVYEQAMVSVSLREY